MPRANRGINRKNQSTESDQEVQVAFRLNLVNYSMLKKTNGYTMKKRSASIFTIGMLFTCTALADYPIVTLNSESVICFKRADIDALSDEFADGNNSGVMRLFESGKCVVIRKDTRVSYLDPAKDGEYALIQLPSGRTAFAFSHTISK